MDHIEWLDAYPMKRGAANDAIERELAHEIARREVAQGFHKPRRSADALVETYLIQLNRAYRIAPIYRKAFTEMYVALHPESALDDEGRVQLFLEARCVRDPKAQIPIAELHQAYLNWTGGHYYLSVRQFIQCLLLLDPTFTRSTQRVGHTTARAIRGLRLDLNADLL